MNTSGIGSQNANNLLQKFRLQRGLLFGTLIISALLAFEIFNYSTTDFALGDLLGDIRFAGVHWSTILAIAFCGIDFAGIARLFTPQDGADEPAEVWYLFGAWMLAATMNAMLTWWGVSLAILSHQTLGNAVIERATLLKIVPIFVAVMVWLIRVLIIGSFSIAGERLFSQPGARNYSQRGLASRPLGNSRSLPSSLPRAETPLSRPSVNQAASPAGAFRGNQRTSNNNTAVEPTYTRPEPTYHPASMGSRNGSNGSSGNSNSRSGSGNSSKTHEF